MKNRKGQSILGRCASIGQRLFFFALLTVISIGMYAQGKTVSGTVVDKTGETVIGASVVVKGTTNGTITDFDGKFTLSNVPNDGTIEISFVGYKTQTISVAGKSTVQVVLEEDTEVLDEVVVVGMGTQRKVSVAGAITTMDPAQLEVPATNIVNTLAGRVAGVIGVQSSGEPGKNISEFWVRGRTGLCG